MKLVLCLFALIPHIWAFIPPQPNHLVHGPKIKIDNRIFSPARWPGNNSFEKKETSVSELSSSITSHIAKSTTSYFPPAVRNSLLACVGLFLILKRQHIFYPGSFPDSSFKEPLPPGKINGCPWMGSLSYMTAMNRVTSDKAHEIASTPPKMFKFYGFGKPVVLLSGSSKVRNLMKREFGGGVNQYGAGEGDLMKLFFGSESMLSETSDGKKYSSLQKLVGQALTPQSVAKSIPDLQELSEKLINQMLESKENIEINKVTHRLALDVTMRQIIGLNLKTKEEIDEFHKSVQTWMTVMSNVFLYILPLPQKILKMTKEYKAKKVIDSLIEERINYLRENGPDSSTLSGMVFATDDEAEEGQRSKLTQKQIIDNVYVLIIAGSDTSSLTLTNAMLLLGMNPDVWKQVVAEQEDLIAKHGPNLTKEQLDNDCPYLTAVIKETMRLLPISGGLFRDIKETVIMDDMQIPKGWLAICCPSLTHELDPITYKKDRSHMDVKTGFKPERWLSEETRPTEFMSFGAGRRYCLGHTLANAEMLTFLAMMARKVKSFDLLTNTEKLKWKEGIITIPNDGVVINAYGKS